MQKSQIQIAYFGTVLLRKVLNFISCTDLQLFLLLTTVQNLCKNAGAIRHGGCWFAGLVGFFLVLPRISRRVQVQVQPEHAQAVAIRTAFWLVFALMLFVSMVLWIWVYQVPDVRHLEWLALAESEFAIGQATARSELAGLIVGAQLALDSMFWYFMQTAEAPMLAWLVFAFYQALQLYIVFTFFVSFYLFFLTSNPKSTRSSGWVRKLGVGPFLVGIFSLVSVYVLFALGSAQLERVANERIATSESPEVTCTRKLLSELEEASDSHLQEQEHALNMQIEGYIGTELDVLFSQLELGVDAFLDWNFSILGQYTQLYMLARAGVSDREFEEDLNTRFMSFSEVDMDDELAGITNRVYQTFEGELQAVSNAQNSWVSAQFTQLRGEYDCGLAAMPTFQFEEFTTYSGVGLSVLSASAYTGFRLANFARVARMAIQRAILRRGAAKAGQSATSAGAGAVCGPFVLVCGAAIFAGADFALVKADEYANRERLRAELMAALTTERARIESSLNEQSRWAIESFQADLAEQQEEKFNILRDGLLRKPPNSR